MDAHGARPHSSPSPLSRTWRSVPHMFFATAEAQGARPFLHDKKDGAWRAWSWRRIACEVAAIASTLRAAGVRPAARVALCAANGPRWIIADLGVMAAGAVSVPMYVSNTEDDHGHVLSSVEAEAVVCDIAALPSLRRAMRDMSFACVIDMGEAFGGEGLRFGAKVVSWREASAAREPSPLPWRALKRKDLASVIHTSGTGGRPKGVMLEHGAFLANCEGVRRLIAPLGAVPGERFLSFLPLAHSFERIVGEFLAIMVVAEVFYAESLEKLFLNMGEARPTIVCAVPRLYEALHQRIVAGLKRASGLRRGLMRATLNLGAKRREGRLGAVGAVFDRLLDVVVRRSLRARFGGRLKMFVSGGAALDVEVACFLDSLGLPILEGYGQTECAPIISCNPPLARRPGSVGLPIPGLAVRLSKEGEILARGESVMRGYWRDEAATVEALADGWLHTGDVGALDDAGYLTITDRLKDMIVNSGGENIAPQKIEGCLVFEPDIAQAAVFGDGRAWLSAVLVAERGEGRARLGAAVARANARLAPHERVKRFIVADGAFTIDNGLLTPTLKVRRRLVGEVYGRRIAELYGGGRRG